MYIIDPHLIDAAFGLLPIALLIGAWWVFTRMSTKRGGAALELMTRQTVALERIADALERSRDR